MAKPFLISSLLFLAAAAQAQTEQIHLRVLNGKTGKPLASQRILFFGGDKQENSHAHFVEATTDKYGLAVFTVDRSKIVWLQAFPDFMIGCTPDPNNHFFDVKAILVTGLSAPNACSKTVTQPIQLGYFTFFVRKPTLRERMDW